MRALRTVLAALAIAASAGEVRSADVPLSGGQISIRRSANGSGAVTVVLKNPAIPVPAAGSADDPSLTGMTLTLFGRTSGTTATFVAAPGATAGTWKVGSAAARTTFSYVDHEARSAAGRVESAQLRTGSGVKLKAPDAGLALNALEQAVGVRVEWGTQRVCALFDYDDVRVTKAGRFLARDADAAPMPDCSDDTMTGGPLAPCGVSAPSCGGTCPSGQACRSVGDVTHPGCQCEPVEGGCPDGCPDGWICYRGDFCLAPFCGGAEGTCDGTCAQPGTQCFQGSAGFCFCLTPCSGGDPWPTCGGSCPDPKTDCVASPFGDCVCG